MSRRLLTFSALSNLVIESQFSKQSIECSCGEMTVPLLAVTTSWHFV